MVRHPSLPDPDFEHTHEIFEHAHAPFAGSERLSLGVSIEFLSLADGTHLRQALADLVPAVWRWSKSDAHGCFSGQAEAYLPAGYEHEAEQALKAVVEIFAPGYSIAWVHLIA